MGRTRCQISECRSYLRCVKQIWCEAAGAIQSFNLLLQEIRETGETDNAEMMPLLLKLVLSWDLWLLLLGLLPRYNLLVLTALA